MPKTDVKTQGKNSENNPGKNKVGALIFCNSKLTEKLQNERECGASIRTFR